MGGIQSAKNPLPRFTFPKVKRIRFATPLQRCVAMAPSHLWKGETRQNAKTTRTCGAFHPFGQKSYSHCAIVFFPRQPLSRNALSHAL